jgi:hypothetical protein
MEAIKTSHNGLVKESDKLVSVHFDSIIEFLDYKCTNSNERRFKEYTKESSGRGVAWLGKTNNNAKDVINHALGGDQKMCDDLIRKIDQFKSAIGAERTDYSAPIRKVKRKRIKSDFGDAIDIHKVYQGQLDQAWDRMVRIEADRISPLVTICIDLCGSAMEDCSSSYWRAAVALHLSDELQAAGKSVKIVVAMASDGAMTNSKKRMSTSIVIKEFNQQVNIERIAAMTHFGFLRTFMFGIMCVQDYITCSSLGCPVDITEKNMSLHLQEEVDAGHVKLLHVGRVKNQSGAEAELKKLYKTIGDYRN